MKFDRLLHKSWAQTLDFRANLVEKAKLHAGFKSYGAYQIDGSSTMTFHIDGSLVRTLIGKYLERKYEISGNRLTITSTNPNEHWKVVWERF